MRCLLTVLLVCLGLPCGLAGQEEDAKKDQEAMQGTWTFVQLVHDGYANAEQQIKDVKMVIKGEKITWIIPNHPDGKEVHQDYSYKLNPQNKPNHIDVMRLDGEFKGKTVPGIYELKGDDLKICLPNNSKAARPTEFTSASGSKLMLFVLKKAK